MEGYKRTRWEVWVINLISI